MTCHHLAAFRFREYIAHARCHWSSGSRCERASRHCALTRIHFSFVVCDCEKWSTRYERRLCQAENYVHITLAVTQPLFADSFGCPVATKADACKGCLESPCMPQDRASSVRPATSSASMRRGLRHAAILCNLSGSVLQIRSAAAAGGSSGGLRLCSDLWPLGQFAL